MANQLYATGRNAFLTGAIAWLTDNIKAILVHTSAGGTPYVPNFTTDAFLTDIPGAAIVATSANLSSKTASAGTANAANVTFATVSGVQVDAIVLYKDTGTGSTSQLIAYIDTATGLPVVPNGGDITCAWDTGANKIFTL